MVSCHWPNGNGTWRTGRTVWQQSEGASRTLAREPLRKNQRQSTDKLRDWDAKKRTRRIAQKESGTFDSLGIEYL